LEVRVTGVAFSPTGRAFCAASTEGLLIYSLDTTHLFDPYDLDVTVTPASTLYVLRNEKDYLKALVMAFRLNETPLVRKVFEGTPHTNIALVVQELPIVYVPRLLRFIALQTEESPHLEFCLLWIKAILESHGQWLGDNRGTVDAEMRTVSRAVGKIRDDIRLLADENIYMLDYLLSRTAAPISIEIAGVDETTKFITNGQKEARHMDEDSDAEWVGLD
jgi:periodic tryptophan protein 2